MYAQYAQQTLPQQNASPLRDERLSILPAFAVFLIGAASGYPVQFVGKLYPGELILALLGIMSFFGLFAMPKAYRSQVLILLGAMLVGLSGYILSDLYRKTATNDYLRGWAQWGFMILNFLGLVKLSYRQPKYLIAFMLGFSLVNGSIPLLAPANPYGGINSWKFYVAVPSILGCLFFARKWRPSVIVVVLVFIAACSAAFDTRSIALLCLLTAGTVFLAGKKKDVLQQRSVKKRHLVWTVVVLAISGLGGVFLIQKYAEELDLADRQARSSSTRFALAMSTIDIVRQSPFIGYGSWARNPELAKKQDKVIKKLKAKLFRPEQRKDLIVAHSQVLQTWLEGGILGTFFCLFLGVRLGLSIINLGLRYPYHPFVPIYAFLLWHSSWHLIFSPFRGTQRIFMAFACVIIVRIAYDLSLLRTASSSQEWFQYYWNRATDPRQGYEQLGTR